MAACNVTWKFLRPLILGRKRLHHSPWKCRNLSKAQKGASAGRLPAVVNQVRKECTAAACCQNVQAGTAAYLPRRILLSSAALSSALASLTEPAEASKLPGIFDKAWEKIGGGPADLYFPEAFAGRWIVDAVLTKVEMPLGAKFVPDTAVGNFIFNCPWQAHRSSAMHMLQK